MTKVDNISQAAAVAAAVAAAAARRLSETAKPGKCGKKYAAATAYMRYMECDMSGNYSLPALISISMHYVGY